MVSFSFGGEVEDMEIPVLWGSPGKLSRPYHERYNHVTNMDQVPKAAWKFPAKCVWNVHAICPGWGNFPLSVFLTVRVRNLKQNKWHPLLFLNQSPFRLFSLQMWIWSVAFCCATLGLVHAAVPFSTRDCMEACANCATFYGRDLYDARSCLGSCQQSAGYTADPQCTNEIYHFVKRSGPPNPELLQFAGKRSSQTHLCIQHCGMCVMLWTKEVYDGMRCIQQCRVTAGHRTDRECSDPANNRLLLGSKHIWTPNAVAKIVPPSCFRLYITCIFVFLKFAEKAI